MRKKAARQAKKTYRNGSCASCNKEVVDWERIDKRDPNDVQYTFESLKSEYIRHEFWQASMDEKALEKAEEKGLAALRQEAEKIVRRTLQKPSNENHWDGRQTPRSGNVIHYAQHAVAACCRKCAEEWYGIDRNSQLTDNDVLYLSGLVIRYIQERLPQLTEEGQDNAPKKELTGRRG